MRRERACFQAENPPKMNSTPVPRRSLEAQDQVDDSPIASVGTVISK